METNDLAEDIAATPALVVKIKERDDYAQNLYAAMCNMQWQKTDVMPILKDELWSCTWRSAGGIVADLRGEGDYLSWYCSGISGGSYLQDDYDDLVDKGYVKESHITDEILADLKQIGWHPVPWKD